jgi:curli biogenesis system outer membrane secretion channel CsgG
MRKVLFFLIASAFIVLGCATSKSLTKKAKSLEDAQQYQTASELYYQAVKKKPTNVEALAGMKRTGTQVLSDYLSKFTKAKLDEDYKTATYAYLDAEAYQKRIKAIKVDLTIPEFTTEDFKNVKESYLEQTYEQGLELIDQEQFSDAEKKFNEVHKFDANFRDVKELRNIAYLEPLYRKGEEFKNNREYRKAYEAYGKVLKRVPNYKDTKENRAYVLEKGRINVVFLSDKKKRNTKYGQSTQTLRGYAINAIINMKDPFIKVVDRDNMDKIIKEQELSVSGLVSEKEALEVGELSGAQYAVSIETTALTYKDNPLKKTAHRGHEQYREKSTNKETGQTVYKTKYRSATYHTYRASRNSGITAHFKLLSLKTGEILSSQIVEKTEKSAVHYLSYNGNINKLYPGKDGRVNTSKTAHDNLVALSKNSRQLATKESLTKQLYKTAGEEIKNLVFEGLENR